MPQDCWLGPAGLALLVLVVHGVLRWRAPYADPVMLPIATVLNGLGLVVIHRLDLAHHFNGVRPSLATRQLMWSAIGIACAVVRARRRPRPPGAGPVHLHRDDRRLRAAPAAAPARDRARDPRRPDLDRPGPLSFQPGEIAKILLALFFAGYLVTARDSLSLVGRRFLGLQLPRGRDLGPILVAWLASLGVLVFESDLGTSLLFFGLFVVMLYVATERTSWIVIGMLLFAGGAFAA